MPERRSYIASNRPPARRLLLVGAFGIIACAPPARDFGSGSGHEGGGANVGSTTASAGGASTITSSSGTSHPAGRCGVGSIDEIYDAFEDNVTNTMLWNPFADGAHNETSVIEIGGAVVAKSNGTKDIFAGYYQIGLPRKLNDCSAFIEVREAADRAQPVSTFFMLLDDSQGDRRKNVYSISQVQGHLQFDAKIDGNSSTDGSKDITYNAAEHRWWRFRESEGRSYMETSPDGKTWTTQANFATPAFASNMRIMFGIGATDIGTSETSAVFDNLNVPPP